MPGFRIDFLYLPEPGMIAAAVADMAGCVDTTSEMSAELKRGDNRMAGVENRKIGLPRSSTCRRTLAPGGRGSRGSDGHWVGCERCS